MEPSPELALARVPLFAGLDPEMLAALARRLVPVRLSRGEVLCWEGDLGAELFVVESGEVRVLARSGAREVCRLGPGEHVGEMAVIDPAPRSATVQAARDSRLWKLRIEDFESLAGADSKLYRQIAIALARRLRSTTAGAWPNSTVRTVLLVDLRRSVLLRDEQTGSSRASGTGADGLSATLLAAVEEILGGRVGVVRLHCRSDSDGLGLKLDTLRQKHGYVFLMFDPEASGDLSIAPDNLLRAIYGQVDLSLLLLTTDSQAMAQAEQHLRRLDGLGLSQAPLVELVLDRRDERPRKSFLPVDRVAAGRVVHTVDYTPGYARSGAPDYGGTGRLARRIAGRRVGLSLGGGGARAFAHLGVLEVLEREGIPVDVLAGTSGGAIVAGLTARDWEAQRTSDFLLSHWTRRRVIDWRLFPWDSMLHGRKLARIGLEAGEGLTIEELSRPFVAVATDLVTGEEVRLRRGDGWTAVRASLSVPGVFPPVRLGNRLLVDGGALDNLPVPAARELGANSVIGINVTPPMERTFLPPPDDTTRPGFLGRFLARMRGGFPLLRIIYRTVTVQSQALRGKQGEPDLMLSPDTAGFDMFEFSNLDRIIARGRTEAENRIAEIRRAAFGDVAQDRSRDTDLE